MYTYFGHVWTWLDINVFNSNIFFVIFLWMKYMEHTLIDMLNLSSLECTRVCYECLLSKQGRGIRVVHSLQEWSWKITQWMQWVLDYHWTCRGKLLFPLFIFSLRCHKRKPLRHLVNYGKSDCLYIKFLNVGVSDKGGGSYFKG